MSRRRATWRLAAAVAVAVALAALHGGCAGDATSVPPVAASCTVHGSAARFGTAGKRVEVLFVRVGEETGRFEGRVGNTGDYRLDLPPGNYLAGISVDYRDYWLGAGGALATHDDEADTLRLRAGAPETRLDFPLGAVRIEGAIPAGLAADVLRISYHLRREGTEATSIIDEDDCDASGGVFTFDSGPLPLGDYHVAFNRVVASGQTGERFWLPGTSRVDDATWYHVASDSLCRVPVTMPGPPARLEGHVTGAWQAMGGGFAEIFAYDLDGNLVAGPWHPAADGAFALEFLVAQAVRLQVRGRESVCWVGGRTAAEATVHALSPGATTTGADAVIPGAIIYASLAAPAGDYENVYLRFLDPVNRSVVHAFFVPLGAVVPVDCMYPGQYLLHATNDSGMSGRSSFREQWYDRAATPEEATLVTIPDNGGVAHIDIVMERGGTIGGTVALAGPGVEWGCAFWSDADSDTLRGYQWSTTNGDGSGESYLLEGLTDGSYKLCFIRGGATYWDIGKPAPAGVTWYPGTTDWNAATPLVISGANDITGIDFTVP